MIPFSPPHIDQKIIDEVIDTLKSGWITTGPKTKRLEKKLTLYCGSQSTLCLSSATAGLELALRWFGIREGDEVIVPAYTYCATANVIVHCGAVPVMADVNPEDNNISVESIKKLITGKTKAILPVDIAGMPCDLDEIFELINMPEIKNLFVPDSDEQKLLGRILVLEDAAHSLGARYKGRKIGSIADITAFSFHAVKNLTTAEGGALALNLPLPFDNDEIYNKLNILSLHGQNKDALSKNTTGAWKYDVIFAGYKANMTDILASIGLVEIDRYDTEILEKRRKIFDLYQKGFEKCPWAEIPLYRTAEKESSYHVFLLKIKGISEDTRDRIIEKIFESGVSVNVHFQPLPMLTIYKSMGYDISLYPKAFDCYSRVISLPVYYDLTLKNIHYIIETIKRSVQSTIG